MLPEHFISKLYHQVKPEWKAAFFSAFLSGFLIHLYRLTNPLLTWDSLYNFHDPQNTIHLGRCFLTIACGISSYYDLPLVNGLLSLIYLALTTVCLTEIFGLKGRLMILLTAGITVTFPAVASTLLYMYTADGYFLAMLCAALAVLLTLKFRWGWLPGLFLLGFSYGSYQAYVSYAVMLILMWAILNLTLSERSLQDFFRQLGCFLLMGAGGTLLYAILNKLLSLIQGVNASSYQGISAMKIPGPSEFLRAIPSALTEFAYFFFGPLDAYDLFKVLNIFLFLLLAAVLSFTVYAARLYKKPARLVLTGCCVLLLPFGCCMIYFVSSGVRYHMLMMMGFSLIYLLPLLLLERLGQALSEIRRPAASSSAISNANLNLSHSMPLLFWAGFLITSLCIYNFALTDNIAYLYAHRSYEETYALTLQMADRMEQTEGFENVSRLCILGHMDGHDDIDISLPPKMTGIKEGILTTEQNHFAAFFTTYLNIPLDGCSEEESEALKISPTVQAMDIWPGAHSVQIEGDTVIIKIGED